MKLGSSYIENLISENKTIANSKENEKLHKKEDIIIAHLCDSGVTFI